VAPLVGALEFWMRAAMGQTRARMSPIVAHLWGQVRQHLRPQHAEAAAIKPANILCYEMNGARLPAANSCPLRL